MFLSWDLWRRNFLLNSSFAVSILLAYDFYVELCVFSTFMCFFEIDSLNFSFLRRKKIGINDSILL